ncbi:GNAT family N-acetyltransferase [Paenibacillus piscarius]|uniref:GNAT family N-acetyltransferase n=1 Tax=Paenibacillus piscarius TaxID=1089681 RepID=UPI001EE9811E
MIDNSISFQAARAIMEEHNVNFHPSFAYSVLDHYIAGEAIVDGCSALIGTSSGIYAVVGDEKNVHFMDLLMDKFKSRRTANQRFTLFSPSKLWDLSIMRHFGAELAQLRRYAFDFNEEHFLGSSRVGCPANFQLNKINKDAIEANSTFDSAYITQYWGSADNFSNKGFGFFVTQDNRYASECISIFSSLNCAEIDIVTHEHFRGRGLAQYMSEAFIQECIDRGLLPKWDCNIHNLASTRLAGKLGFDHPTTYSVFVMR